ncbi:hypothetical protein WN48_07279 [Eufriesea mexicana]|uniref:Centriolar and ciliogenesis-associated protein HYLS1 C-terminal domain-containing protein n=1 Tax=Eufriesea mexicana TaxID=516756 RepID=A0A310SHZ6_9HYME|nr:hypothetical protein WN48_07279 [Eufriesea mexicana]
MNDDPRDVLVLLNSLGFVGITAEQLKAFMKELLREEKTEFYSVENTISTNSSSSYIDDSLVKVKVTKLSNDKRNKNFINIEKNYINTKDKLDMLQPKSKSMKTQENYSVKSSSISYDNEEDKPQLKSKSKYEECLRKDFHIGIQSKMKPQHDKIANQGKSTPIQSIRPMSAPNILEHQQEHVTSSQTKSTSSTRNTYSGTKSFIRPWRLQLDSQRSKNLKKTDPVILYQKYQQEWKQMSFPGEAKHSSVRWAIREKMLGGDPQPMPLSKKSSSMPILKKK